MIFRAQSAAVALLLAAAVASAVEVGAVTRQFAGIDIKGEYDLFVKQGKCPRKIVHSNITTSWLKHMSGTYTAYTVNHTDITQNGESCSSKDSLRIVPNTYIDAAGYRKQLGAQAPVVKDLNKQNASFLVGVELMKRDCGSTYLSKNSLAIFVEQESKIRVPGLITLYPGAKYMIIYEKDSPTPCTYFQKDPSRVIGEALLPPVEASPETPVPTPIASDAEKVAEDAVGSTLEVDPMPSSEPDGSSTCFPADATVSLENGSVKRMDALQLGDRVQVAHGEFSNVFMFTHRNAGVISRFVELTTQSGTTLHLTPGHYLYANRKLIPASAARVGDVVDLANGESSAIETVSSAQKTGIYNPQTVHGNIVVNGVLTSTYTTTVHPGAAHSLLAPLRSLFSTFSFSTSSLDQGSDKLASMAPKGSTFA